MWYDYVQRTTIVWFECGMTTCTYNYCLVFNGVYRTVIGLRVEMRLVLYWDQWDYGSWSQLPGIYTTDCPAKAGAIHSLSMSWTSFLDIL